MWSISGKIKLLFGITLFWLFSQCAFQQGLESTKEKKALPEKQVVLTIDSLLRAGDFVRAEKYARLFEKRYPFSPYADDIAFRLAYLHVIALKNNPFYDYEEAREAFEKFLIKYPESRYALACNNWLKVLYLSFRLEKRINELEKENRRVRKQIEEKAEKIIQLQNTLQDIEKVIKR
ncbi:outer membrane protein assembly factor BamD [Caldithrix abyssi]